MRGKPYRLLSRLFGRGPVKETVVTEVRFETSPETVWNHLMFYEDVPGRPASLLRMLLPYPVRTEGDKTVVGSTVHCAYHDGDLAKRITRIEPAHLLQFEVVEQRLGIERCIRARGGSYEIRPCGEASEVRLTTTYEARLHPRHVWRPVEALLVSQLHRHILCGIGAALAGRSINRAAPADFIAP